MDLSRLLHLVIVVVVAAFVTVAAAPEAEGAGFFRVRSRFGGQLGLRKLEDLRAHDARRHGRLLAAAPAELPLGGSALPTETGLYYTKISLGTPPKDFYVQVDTGSDILWVNCINCKHCPKKSSFGISMTLYDPKGSGSGHLVTCEQSFCAATYGGEFPGCNPSMLCQYSVLYGDGSSTAGFFVSDVLQYQQVTGHNQTKAVNATITFGCGAQQSGDLGSSGEAVDGILGFGQSNSSMISQLASSGKVRKIFSHCLDTVNGGGIFAIGDVVLPKLKTTPLVPNQPHYNVELKGIDVDGDFLKLPTDVFDSSEEGTIIDSGTTLAYLPEQAYRRLMNAIFSHVSDVNFHHVQNYLCFRYTQSVDDGFPKVTFHFADSLSLTVHPHDYLFENKDNEYCVGWQSGGVQTRDGKDIFLLGDMALSNKLVVYDLENQVIGWTDYNCSSSIKVAGDKTGSMYTINAQDLSFAACRLKMARSALLLLLTTISYFLTY